MAEGFEFGVVLPQTRGATWEQTLEFAQAAEAAGFDSLWLIDHVYGFPPDSGILEAWTLLSALAPVTETVGLGAQVFCQSFRNPALMAKMTTTLDLVSGGRMHFLIGAGWFQAEYEGFGYDFPPPGVRFAELRDTVRICRGMWDSNGSPFTYEGKHYRVKDVVNLPAPTRRIPLGIGAGGDRMLDLIAREADEWNCPAALLGTYDERVRFLEERLAKYERDVRRTLQIVFAPGEGDPPAGLAMFNPQLGVVGSEDRMTQRVGELKEKGVSGLFGIVPGRRGMDAMAEALPALRAAVA